MKKAIVSAALIALCIQPVAAQMVSAPLPGGTEPVAMGGFVGARVRIALGGTRSEEQTLRAGVTIAPMQYRGGGEFQGFRSRIGEGLEFGFRGDEPAPQLSFAGMRLTGGQSAPGKGAPGKGRNNLSGDTSTGIIIGLVVLTGGALLLALGDSKDSCTGGECNNN